MVNVALVDYDAERPAYRVLDPAGFFGPDHTLYEENSEVYFDGEPCEQMEPLNQSAKIKYVAYLEKLEELGRLAAEKAGRPFAGRPRHLDGQLALATAIQRSEMQVLGTRNFEAPEITKIETSGIDNTPQLGIQVKKQRGRPRKLSESV